jgi:hypothetical protein
MHEDGYRFVGSSGEGQFRPFRALSAGNVPASRDLGDLTDDGTVILLFDTMCAELLLYMPGSLSLFPEISRSR